MGDIHSVGYYLYFMQNCLIFFPYTTGESLFLKNLPILYMAFREVRYNCNMVE